jgi:hypothetical protein
MERRSATLAQYGPPTVGHAVTLAQRASQMSPLIFRRSAIMLAVALAKDWL